MRFWFLLVLVVGGVINHDSNGGLSLTTPSLPRAATDNGDADSCVPYIGNEEWIDGLVAAGDLVEHAPWRPWFTEAVPSMPAGCKALDIAVHPEPASLNSLLVTPWHCFLVLCPPPTR